MREVTTNLGHVRPPLGCAVKVDDGVTVLHQVGPDLMGYAASC